MDAREFPVEVHPLDQLILPGSAEMGRIAASGFTDPTLAAAGEPVALHLVETAEGSRLAEGIKLGGHSFAVGAEVRLERKAPAPGAIVIRIDGQRVALAAAANGGLLRPEGDPMAPLAGFLRGTLIDTPDGARPVEALVPGDLVTTLDNGSQPLIWVGRQTLALAELLAEPALRPVEFAAGAAGNAAALTVASSQRMLIDDWRAEVYFAEDRVLVAAQALIDDRLARQVLPVAGVEYWQLLCRRHEIVLAEGALTESFHPGEAGYLGLSDRNRAEAEALVPEADIQRRRAACPVVRNAEARALRLSG
jgi:hypothetical protein